MAQSPEEIIKALIGEKFRKVRLGAGVVGKTTTAIISLIVAWTVIIFKISSDPWENAVLIIAGIIATGAIIWWIKTTHRFAESNPLQAMLSGAQFVEYQKSFSAQTKSIPAPTNTTLIEDPNLPATPSSDPQIKDK